MLYEKLFGNVMALNRYLRMQYIVPEINKIRDSKVLDIGCLDGHFTSYLTGRGNKVFAVDLQDNGITKALPEVEFYPARGECLPFDDDQFDFVFCSDVFEHVKYFEKLVPEICRVLKPGRTCLISTVDGYWNSPVKLRSFLLKFLPGKWKGTLMGRFAESDRDLHINFMGHVRYDISIQKLEDIFGKFKLLPVMKKTYCSFVGSLLMEIFYSFNERLRYVTFPLLRLLLPLDKWLNFGKPWQYYIIFKKTKETCVVHTDPDVNEMFGKRELIKKISDLEIKLRDYQQQNQHLGKVLDDIQGIVPTLEKLLTRVHSEAPSSEMLIEAGEICFGFGNYESARHFFEKAVSLDPENPEALNNLGVLELYKGHNESAQKLFVKVLKINPSHKEAQINLNSMHPVLTQKGYE